MEEAGKRVVGEGGRAEKESPCSALERLRWWLLLLDEGSGSGLVMDAIWADASGFEMCDGGSGSKPKPVLRRT